MKIIVKGIEHIYCNFSYGVFGSGDIYDSKCDSKCFLYLCNKGHGFSKNTILIFLVFISACLYSGCVYNKIATVEYDDATIIMETDKIGLNKDFVVEEKNGTWNTAYDFNGTYTFWTFDAQGETLEFNFTSDLEHGNLKIVLINDQNEITDIFVQNEKGKNSEHKSIKLGFGRSRMKIVGWNNAVGNLEVQANYGVVTGSVQNLNKR